MTKRRILAGSLLLMTSSLALASPKVESIGHPISSVRLLTYDFGTDAEGRDVIYALTIGDPGMLSILDPNSGARRASHRLPNSLGSWGSTVAPDGRLYIATYSQGRLLRYDPAKDEIEDLGIPLPGETFLFQLSFDDSGRIYGGSYPNGKIFRYDPKTGDTRDYGPAKEGESWIRTVLYADNALYIGTDPSALLIRMNPESGERTEIPLPTGPLEGRIYDMTYGNGLLYVRPDPAPHMLVFDIKKQEWVDELDGFHGREVSPPGPDGRVYYRHNSSKIFAYDPSTGAREPTGATTAIGTRQWGWVSIDRDGYPGKTVVSGDHRGNLFYYNPETGNFFRQRGEVERAPNHLHSLGRGPDGAIYAGGYLSPEGMGRYDPETGVTTLIPGVTQVEGMTVHDGVIYMGQYPGAAIARYVPGSDSGESLFRVGEQQDRPFAMASAGSVLAIGTVPESGRLGGALTLYDPATKEVTVHRHVVENQSVTALAYHDGILWGGTSVAGGLQATPVEKEARLFAWDLEKGEKVWEGVTIPGEHAYTSLAFDDDGILWGLINGWIFSFDPVRREVLRSERFTGSGEGARWGQGQRMEYFAPEGKLYGTTLGKAFRFDPRTWEFDVLHEGARLFAQDESGDVYFATSSEVFRIRLTPGNAD